jgi:hypothetical protein
MDKPPDLPRLRRRFRLVDLLVLVAASAFSLWLYRVCVASQMRSPALSHTVQAFSQSRGRFLHWIDWLFAIGFTVVVPGGLALLWLGLLKRRSPLRERFREPGLLACLIASIIVGYSVFDEELSGLIHFKILPYRFLESSTDWLLPRMAWSGDLVPTGVAACWFTLWIAGIWGRSSDWVEKAGRVLGAFWVLSWMFRLLTISLDTWFFPGP